MVTATRRLLQALVAVAAAVAAATATHALTDSVTADNPANAAEPAPATPGLGASGSELGKLIRALPATTPAEQATLAESYERDAFGSGWLDLDGNGPGFGHPWTGSSGRPRPPGSRGRSRTAPGESLPGIAAVNRQFQFVPQGWNNYPVIVVEVVDVRRVPNGTDMVPGNPIRKTELAELAQALAELGHEVVETWNGHPGSSGSVALRGAAHPTLLAAVGRYHAGCPEHPEKTVFCGCGWFQHGYRRVVRPIAGGSLVPEVSEETKS